MKSGLAWAAAGAFVFFNLAMLPALAQAAATTPTPLNQAAPQLTPQQPDQLLAPIALYPDVLLAQILIAATYPVEVVLADRWLQDPHNASLKGDQLAAALEQQNWDPSVKSIVPYPRILRMMDNELDWTERLGEAFLADPAAVMDSIQRLRRRAAAAGHLSSAPQAVVTTQEEAITIESPSLSVVSFPNCDPSVVYGPWPYPAYPPDYFPGYFEGSLAGGFGCGWIVAPIIAPLWGWGQWNWRRHQIDIDRGRFTLLNRNRPPPDGEIWEHDPTHRRGVPYQGPEAQERYVGSAVSPDVRRNLRGFPTSPTPQIHPAPSPLSAPIEERRPALGGTAVRPPPTFESFGPGSQVRTQAERGNASRMSMPAFAPGGFGPRSAPGGFAPQIRVPSVGGMRR